jgi:hypothetical protein
LRIGRFMHALEFCYMPLGKHPDIVLIFILLRPVSLLNQIVLTRLSQLSYCCKSASLPSLCGCISMCTAPVSLAVMRMCNDSCSWRVKAHGVDPLPCLLASLCSSVEMNPVADSSPASASCQDGSCTIVTPASCQQGGGRVRV